MCAGGGGNTVEIHGSPSGSNGRQLIVGTVEHQVGTEYLGGIGQDSAKGKGRHKSVGNVLYGGGIGSGSGGAIVWIGVLGPVNINRQNSVRGSH